MISAHRRRLSVKPRPVIILDGGTAGARISTLLTRTGFRLQTSQSWPFGTVHRRAMGRNDIWVVRTGGPRRGAEHGGGHRPRLGNPGEATAGRTAGSHRSDRRIDPGDLTRTVRRDDEPRRTIQPPSLSAPVSSAPQHRRVRINNPQTRHRAGAERDNEFTRCHLSFPKIRSVRIRAVKGDIKHHRLARLTNDRLRRDPGARPVSRGVPSFAPCHLVPLVRARLARAPPSPDIQRLALCTPSM
jgi:hypothetical protein